MGWQRQRTTKTAIDLPFLVYQLERRLGGPRRFRFAEEKIAVRLVQRVSKEIEYRLLQVRFQVNQKVAANDEIDPGKRHATANVLLSEDHRLAQHLRDAKTVIDAFEEAVVIIIRQVGENVFRVKSAPRKRNGVRREIGSEDLDAPLRKGRTELVRDEQRHRISFFTRGTAGRPNTQDASVLLCAIDQFRHHGTAEEIKCFRIAEEARHFDQKCSY